MIKINLVSEGRRPVVARKAKQALGVGETSLAETLFLAAFLVGLLAIGGAWWYFQGQVKARQAEVAIAQKEVNELALVLKEVEDFKNKKGELEHKIRVINELKDNQRGPVRIMDQISHSLPELLWVDNLQLRGKNIELRGRAFNTNQVATFIENLNKVPEFQEPRLKEAIRQQGGIYQFSIEFNFSFPQAVVPVSDGAATATGTAAG
jgi:type IV pilus assembly protein PilN